MNETLSSLIAFVGFLIVFSLLIQSVQEALKNLFKLKAGVWERFFINLYKEEFNKTSEQKEKTFWERIKKEQFVGEFEQRLMRLKKIVIRIDDLLKKAKQSIAQIIDLKAGGTDKKMVLKVESLYEELTMIKGLKIETILKLYSEKDEQEIKDGNKTVTIAQLANDFMINYEKFEKDMAEFRKDPESKLEDVIVHCKNVQEIILRLERKLATYRQQIENKADAWLVQLQGEYKKNMLKWTILISIASVLLLNADAFSIYKYFSVNSKAQEVMIENVSSSTDMINKMREKDINSINDAIIKKEFKTARDRIVIVSSKFVKDFLLFNDKKNQTAATQILDAVKSMKEESDDNFQVLAEQLGKLTKLYLIFQISSVDYHMAGLDSVGLPLGWSGNWETFKNPEGSFVFGRVIKKFLGLILTIFLVSFGAPFWQNIMNALIGIKNLSKKSVIV